MKSTLYKIFYRSKASAGFTLIELLAAMAITSIVISVTGYGVVALTDKNSKERAETERRVELNRAQDFISDEVRMAIKVNDKDSKPEWAIDNDKADLSNQSKDWINKLGGGSPEAKLFLQIPLNVDSIDGSADEIDIEKHGFSGGNAVMFTGSGITTAGLQPNVVYYITKDSATDTFKVSTSLENAENKIIVPLNAVSPGSLTVNRLLIYYIRDTENWLGPKTVNRSAGPCARPFQTDNCPVLVDSIAENGFTATAISSRKAEINLRGALDNNASKDLKVSNNAFARLFETLGGADKAADEAEKAAKEAKDAADIAAAERDTAEKAAKEAKDAADKATAEKDAADKAAKEAKDADDKAAADIAAKEAKAAADKAAVEQAAADKAAKDAKDAADKAAVEQAAADKAAKEAKDAADKAAKEAKDADDKAAADKAAKEAKDAADKAAVEQAAAEQAAREAQAAADKAAADKAAAEQSAREAQAAADKKAAEEKAAADKAVADKAAADKAAADKAAADKAAADARAVTNTIFTTNNGVITFTRSATGTFRIIGGDAGGIPTSTTINKTEGNRNTNTSVTASNRDFNVSGAAGTRLTVTGSASSYTYQRISYGGFNANSNTNKDTQVWALRNGDPLPPFTPFPGQVPPRNYLQTAGYLDANGKIKLAENQVIYLFEVTTTNKTRSDYDMQDIIVLATIR